MTLFENSVIRKQKCEESGFEMYFKHFENYFASFGMAHRQKIKPSLDWTFALSVSVMRIFLSVFCQFFVNLIFFGEWNQSGTFFSIWGILFDLFTLFFIFVMLRWKEGRTISGDLSIPFLGKFLNTMGCFN